MIDWQRVGELRDDVGADDFADVVELFLEEVAEVVERLGGAQDSSGVEADLHFLKGSALNLGFTDLGRVCAEGEAMARNGHAGDVDISSVITIYEVSLGDFQAGLRETRAA